MKFVETPLKGAFVVEPEPLLDGKEFFSTFCAREFEERGLCCDIAQSSISHNIKKGTLRGMHYQKPPHAEVKLVSCVRGAIFDVIVDMREPSATYKKWFGIELSDSNFKSIYIPEGFAHGFLSLRDDSVVSYCMSALHAPDSQGLLLWNDPEIAVEWPDIGCEFIISDRDRG